MINGRIVQKPFNGRCAKGIGDVHDLLHLLCDMNVCRAIAMGADKFTEIGG